jgi:S1-C subfamily serine protease
MAKKKATISILTFVLLAVVFGTAVWPSIYDYQCKNRVYSDIEAESNSVESCNIRIIAVSEREEENVVSISYSAGASGVIYDCKGSVYYALTACHVVDSKDAKSFIIATTLTPTYGEYRKEKGLTSHIPLTDYYALMPEAKIEYRNEENDVAIISFQYPEKLEVAEITSENPNKDDRILVIGNPADMENRFAHSYGKIDSSQTIAFDARDGRSPTQVLKHSAYVSPGYSGGAVFSDQMQLVGINIGGGTDFWGRFRYGVMVPSLQIKKCIADWNNQQ